MTDSEANVLSRPGGSESPVIRASAGEASALTLAAWRTSFVSSASPGFGDAATLAAMSGVLPVCASLSLSLPQRRSTSPARESVRLGGGFLPAPQPHFAALPPAVQHGPPLAAVRSAALTFTRRSAATRQRCRKSDESPNHALQRTAPARHTGCSRPPRCARPQPPFRSQCAAPPQSLSLGSFGDSARVS